MVYYDVVINTLVGKSYISRRIEMTRLLICASCGNRMTTKDIRNIKKAWFRGMWNGKFFCYNCTVGSILGLIKEVLGDD